MEIAHIVEFVELAKRRRLNETARSLFISPSALSQHVAALENELGTPLFDRSHGLDLTPAGDATFEHAQRLLAEYDAMTKACQDASSRVDIRIPNYYFGTKPLLAARSAYV